MVTPVRILGLAIAVLLVAAICMTSVTGATVIGLCTLVCVALDARRRRPRRQSGSQNTLVVDLTRRA